MQFYCRGRTRVMQNLIYLLLIPNSGLGKSFWKKCKSTESHIMNNEESEPNEEFYVVQNGEEEQQNQEIMPGPVEYPDISIPT